jgi:hypothetical protein
MRMVCYSNGFPDDVEADPDADYDLCFVEVDAVLVSGYC